MHTRFINNQPWQPDLVPRLFRLSPSHRTSLKNAIKKTYIWYAKTRHNLRGRDTLSTNVTKLRHSNIISYIWVRYGNWSRFLLTRTDKTSLLRFCVSFWSLGCFVLEFRLIYDRNGLVIMNIIIIILNTLLRSVKSGLVPFFVHSWVRKVFVRAVYYLLQYWIRYSWYDYRSQ